MASGHYMLAHIIGRFARGTGSQDEPDRILFIIEGMAFDSIALQ